jgi:hypothetical protein
VSGLVRALEAERRPLPELIASISSYDLECQKECAQRKTQDTDNDCAVRLERNANRRQQAPENGQKQPT